MFCNSCGKEVSDSAVSCPNCGHPFKKVDENASPKSRTATLLLCFFFGILGVHRFYVGKVGTGIIQLLTLGGLGIWALIDFIMIICGSFKDKSGKIISEWGK